MHKFLTFLTMVLISFSSVNGAVTPARRPGGISFTGGSTTVQAKPVAGAPNTNGGAMIGNAMRTTSGGLGVSVGSGLRKIGTGATIDRQSNPNSGSAGCSSDQHMEDGSCVPNTYTENCDGLNGYGVKHCDTENGCDSVCVLNECKSGYYLIDGKCTSCPAGSYCDGGVAQPVQCLANTYSEAGSGGCTDCPSGTKSNAGAQSESQCIPITCDAGEFLDGDECVPCPVGSYCAGGVTKSVVCPIGKYAAVGASECTSCPKDMTTSAEGAGTKSECVRTRCDEPTYYLDGGACYKCPAGYECNGTASMTKCSANTYAPSGSGVCKSCDTGMTSEAGAAICHGSDGNSNVVGNNNGDTGGTGASALNKCTSGYYSDSSLSGGCGICPRGYSCDGSASMTRCDKGTYAGVGAAKCEKCPEGTTTSGGGAATVLECISTTTMCGVNQYWNGGGCSNCGENSTNPVGVKNTYCTCASGYTANGQSGGATTVTGGNACTFVTVTPTPTTCSPACTNGATCQNGACVGGNSGGDTGSNTGGDALTCGVNRYWNGSSCASCGENSTNPVGVKNTYCTCASGYTANGQSGGATTVTGGAGCTFVTIGGNSGGDTGSNTGGITCAENEFLYNGACIHCNGGTNPAGNSNSYCTCHSGFTADGSPNGPTTVSNSVGCRKVRTVCENDDEYWDIFFDGTEHCLPCGANSINLHKSVSACTCKEGYTDNGQSIGDMVVYDGADCFAIDPTKDVAPTINCARDEYWYGSGCAMCGSGGENPDKNRNSYCTCRPGYTANGIIGGAMTVKNGRDCIQATIYDNDPSACKVGEYLDTINSNICRPCPENSTNPDKNRKENRCTCKDGYTIDGWRNGGTEMFPLTESCIEITKELPTTCSENEYFSYRYCLPCGANSVNTPNSVSAAGNNQWCTCVSGYTADGASDGATRVSNGVACILIAATPKECEPGKYLLDGKCTQCPAGHYCLGGMVDSEAAKLKVCLAGTWSRAGATECTSCDAGLTSDEGAAGPWECMECTSNGSLDNCTPGNVCHITVGENGWWNGGYACTTCTDGRVWVGQLDGACEINPCTGPNDVWNASAQSCHSCVGALSIANEDRTACIHTVICPNSESYNHITKQCEPVSCPADGVRFTVTSGDNGHTIRNCCPGGMFDNENCCVDGMYVDPKSGVGVCLPSKDSTAVKMGEFEMLVNSTTFDDDRELVAAFCINGKATLVENPTESNHGTCTGIEVRKGLYMNDGIYYYGPVKQTFTMSDGTECTLDLEAEEFTPHICNTVIQFKGHSLDHFKGMVTYR